ncbi:hypothetical protein AVEN_182391-1 [Araneus ventricosus]|uniref:Uncharacterized protein n=1 Tax=Araneus ventricosus TaxID=182803 RepID=A0A4Y2RT07_ARAVE|nr:hypothetical protein AVEN_182391-1 [Araneus ventricosus]
MLPPSPQVRSPSTISLLLSLLVLLMLQMSVFREYNLHIHAEFNLKARNQSVTVQQIHFLAIEEIRPGMFQLLTQKMSAKGIEMRVITGDADTYIVRSGLEKQLLIPRERHRPSHVTDCFATTRK